MRGVRFGRDCAGACRVLDVEAESDVTVSSDGGPELVAEEVDDEFEWVIVAEGDCCVRAVALERTAVPLTRLSDWLTDGRTREEPDMKCLRSSRDRC